MGTIYLYKERNIRSILPSNKKDVETVLFPERFLNSLSDEKRKELPKRIFPLLKRYQKFMLSKRRINKKAGKTLYQRDLGKLVRVNLRIESEAWMILGLLSAAHGVSRCFMLNYLFWLDSAGVGDSIDEVLNVGCPPFHNSYSYVWHLDLVEKTILRRIEFDPDPLFSDS
ncbi:DUF1564 domain-containing protein [Leptospira adleri]|uniref:DUF1564 domain-containing protein n=1 Tax=Leptospira adleri TaxID=2023186 RepID=A0A2M9YR55_9LEPT|nr:DUF1564 domain-containing protein [Leptospira adleri]PJZ54005.1 hypothetical protein CH380_05645 [Leptospira adleri]PJZ63329.1 hypothetical protein CH376_03570 [Leptospira adleri]